MAEPDQETQERQQRGGPDALIKTLTAGIASAAAGYAAHKALTRTSAARSDDESNNDDEERDDEENPAGEDEDNGQENARRDDAEAADDEREGDEPEPKAHRGEDDRAEAESSRRPAKPSTLKSVGSSALGSASLALVPVAEHAAESAGHYLAENAPDVVRKTIIPRFINAFEKAN